MFSSIDNDGSPSHVSDNTYECKDSFRQQDQTPENEDFTRASEYLPSRQENHRAFLRHTRPAKHSGPCGGSARPSSLVFDANHCTVDDLRHQVQERAPKKKKAVQFIWQCVSLFAWTLVGSADIFSTGVENQVSQPRSQAVPVARTPAARLVQW